MGRITDHKIFFENGIYPLPDKNEHMHIYRAWMQTYAYPWPYMDNLNSERWPTMMTEVLKLAQIHCTTWARTWQTLPSPKSWVCGSQTAFKEPWVKFRTQGECEGWGERGEKETAKQDTLKFSWPFSSRPNFALLHIWLPVNFCVYSEFGS
jgi:hypothetical protein